MELYIDIVFLISWGMHTFLLWAAGRLCGFSARRRRILLGGFLAALLYCFRLCSGKGAGGIFLTALLLWAGLFTAYHPKQGRNWIRLYGAVMVSSFLMGGFIHMLFTMTRTQCLFGRGIVVEKMYPWWLLPWAAGMAYILLKLGAKWIESHIIRRREYCTAVILWRGRGTEVRLLIDTGNGLKENGKGVPIIQISALYPLFFREEQARILCGNMDGLEQVAFTSLGNPDGRLSGIRAEKLILFFGEKRIIHKNVFVGINECDFAGAYEGILPPCLTEEE